MSRNSFETDQCKPSHIVINFVEVKIRTLTSRITKSKKAWDNHSASSGGLNVLGFISSGRLLFVHWKMNCNHWKSEGVEKSKRRGRGAV